MRAVDYGRESYGDHTKCRIQELVYVEGRSSENTIVTWKIRFRPDCGEKDPDDGDTGRQKSSDGWVDEDEDGDVFRAGSKSSVATAVAISKVLSSALRHRTGSRRTVEALVERFDIEPYSDFSSKDQTS